MDDLKLNNNKAVIYARYSSDSQSEQSIEGQVRVITDYARKNNLPIIEQYIDRAISGTREDRPEFQRMVRDAKKKLFGYVLVYRYDRFSRDRLNSLLYKKELKKVGVKVVSVTEYITDDPQGIFFESIIDGQSEFYSKELSQKVRRGNRESRLKGLYTGGIVPFGYKIIDKKYVINDEEAEIIKKIFYDVLHKKPFKEVCNEINAKGIRTRNGGLFTVPFIGKVIRNQKYMGLIVCHEEEFRNIVPPIVTEEEFNAAKDNAIRNKHRGGHFRPRMRYLLTGMIYCGYCGEHLVGETGTSHVKAKTCFYYYKCNTLKRRTGNCIKETVRKDYIEELIIDTINKTILQSKYIEVLAKKMVEVFNKNVKEDLEFQTNEKNILKVKKGIENIVNIMTSGFINESLKDKLTKLEEEKHALELENIKLKTKRKTKITENDVLSFLKSFKDIDIKNEEHKNRIISRLVKKVILYNDKVIIEVYSLSEHYLFNTNEEKDARSQNKKYRIDDNISIEYREDVIALIRKI